MICIKGKTLVYLLSIHAIVKSTMNTFSTIVPKVLFLFSFLGASNSLTLLSIVLATQMDTLITYI